MARKTMAQIDRELSQKLPSVTDDPQTVAILQHTIELSQLPRIDWQDAQALYDRTVEYFNICVKNQTRASFEGYQLATGLLRSKVQAIREGRVNLSADTREVLEWGLSMLTAQIADLMLAGHTHYGAGMFLLRNNAGYRNNDLPVVAAENTNVLGETQTNAEIAAKYKYLPE